MAPESTQHRDLSRKLGLRRRLLADAVPGAAYVPYLGDGDIAAELYSDRTIYGVDVSAQRVATALERLGEGHHVLRADADKAWPFADRTPEPIAVVDLDAWAYPYDAFRQWWQSGWPRAERVVLVFTDGVRRRMNVGEYHHPAGHRVTLDGPGKEHQVYWARVVEPWLAGAIGDWHVHRTQKYARGFQLYWGAVVAPVAAQKVLGPEKGTGYRFDAEVRAQYLERLRTGARRAAAARAVGVHPDTARMARRRDTDFAAAAKAAEHEADEVVEAALFEAATSGNVTACLAWLYSREPDRWSDRRHIRADVSVSTPVDDEIERLIAELESDDEHTQT